MRRFLSGLLALLLVCSPPAYGMDINGELKKAQLEKVSSATGTEGRIIYDTDLDKATYYNGSSWLTIVDTTTALANPSTTGVVIDGSADENQLRVQGNGTQTSNILVVEKSDGTDFLTVDNSGLTTFTGISVPTSAAGNVYSSTYTATPTITSGSCNTAASGNGYYTRLGNIVALLFTVQVNITASNSNCNFRVNIPINANNFSSAQQGWAAIGGTQGSQGTEGNCWAENANNKLLCIGPKSANTGTTTFTFTGMYWIP